MTPDEPTERERVHDEGEEPEDLRDSRDDDAMRALLKRSLRLGEGQGGDRGAGGDGAERGQGAPAPSPAFLRGVQKRIRTRSRGRFFADGWSTSEPRVSYALVAIVMLLVMGVAYVVLGPAGIAK
jgi:hypothetical protein